MPGIGPQASRLLTEDMCHLQVGGMVAEVESLDRSIQEAIHTGPYGSLPILVFSHDPAKGLPKNNPPRWLLEMQDEWSRLQEGLANLSTCSRRIVAKGSSHYIQLDRPDLIGREVSLFIQQIRGVAPQPTNYGSTITE
jgi:pimeloyl-ACP methyl ester carboxylesterase